MSDRCIFFAGGGTGGHIYPGVAVAEQVVKLDPKVRVHFFCSEREIDAHVLDEAGLEYTKLPAKGLFWRPGAFIRFCRTFWASHKIAKEVIAKSGNAVVVGVGGYVAGPVCYAGHKSRVPVALLNVDIFPGRANKLSARWADEAFVQFEEGGEYFAPRGVKVSVVGCPLRSSFLEPKPERAVKELELEAGKKVLLVTGASSGAASVNEAVCSLLDQMEAFAGDWQVVHLTGKRNYEEVTKRYEGVKIAHKVIGYYDRMADLLAAADLLIGRSGAVSVAEYAVSGTASICMPYPHHRDRHQYFNAEKLVDAGAAVVVDDLPDAKERSEWLWEELERLMKDDEEREKMKANCGEVARPDAARKVAEALLRWWE